MHNKALGTLQREQKGPVAPAPNLQGALQLVVDAVSGWTGITKTVHWHFADQSRIDGVDFYFLDKELGHLHLDGEIHLATSQNLGDVLIAEGAAKPFRYLKGWVEEDVRHIGAASAIALFRRNYERLESDSYRNRF